MKKSYLLCVVAVIMVTILSVSITSCSKSDEDEGFDLSETQIKQYLESGEGIWEVVEYDENGGENNFMTQFKDGKTSGYGGTMEPYSISGNRLYSKSFDKGSIYFYKLNASSFEGKWNNIFRMVGKKIK